MSYVRTEQVESMIKAWQEECRGHPALFNQGNVLRDRLAAIAEAPQPFRSGGVALNSTQELLRTMAEALERHGITIYCPWDGDLSDEEQERFAGLVAVLDVVEKAAKP